MELEKFIEEKSQTKEGKMAVIFYSLFIITNRIETSYNNNMEDITLKQLMLLILVSISEGKSFTEYGELMGSSRQNIKSLAVSLEKKGYISIKQNAQDLRASGLYPENKAPEHFIDWDPFYGDQLKHLFSDFSDKDINQTYTLINKLFSGLEKMEEANEKK